MTTIPPAKSLSDLKTRLRDVSRQVRNAMRLRNATEQLLARALERYFETSEALLSATREAP